LSKHKATAGNQLRITSRRKSDIIADILNRLTKLETKIDILTQLLPPLKALEKLTNFEELNLSQDEIKEIVSEALKTIELKPELITARIREKWSEFDERVSELVGKHLARIDQKFKKPTGKASDYLRLGNIEYGKGNYEKALEFYQTALKINPLYVEAYNNRGVVLDLLGQPEQALKDFDKALELKSDDAEIWCNKAVVLGKLNKYNEALQAYKTATQLDPKNPNVWYQRAWAYSLKGDKINALMNLSRAIELNENVKEKVKKDKDFEPYWEDEDFKKVIG